MEFLEDLEMYEEAMENAYLIITRKLTLDDIYMKFEEKGIADRFCLPFDPMEEDGRTADVIDMVIEYYTGTEEYEKCAELLKIKNKCLDLKI